MGTIMMRQQDERSAPTVIPREEALNKVSPVLQTVRTRRETQQAALIDEEIARREAANRTWLRRKVPRPLNTDPESVRNDLTDPPHGDTLGNDAWLMTEFAGAHYEGAADRIRTAALLAPAGSTTITVRQSDWDAVLRYTGI